MLRITEAAKEVLHRAQDAATRFNPDARVRIHRRGEAVETAFADSPEGSDEVIEADGLTLFVAEGVDGVLDVSIEHDHLIVRPEE